MSALFWGKRKKRYCKGTANFWNNAKFCVHRVRFLQRLWRVFQKEWTRTLSCPPSVAWDGHQIRFDWLCVTQKSRSQILLQSWRQGGTHVPQVIYRIVCPKTYGATQRQRPLSDILWHPNKSSESSSSSSASANPYVIPEILLDGDGLNCALFS